MLHVGVTKNTSIVYIGCCLTSKGQGESWPFIFISNLFINLFFNSNKNIIFVLLNIYNLNNIIMERSDIKDQLAILKVQEEDVWRLCDKLNWPKNLQTHLDTASTATKKFEKENFESRISITGFCNNEDIEHFEIDDAITAKFFVEISTNEIQPDSESGMFACNTTNKFLPKIKKFLKAEYPDLKFSHEEDTFSFISPFSNWNDSRQYVTEHKIEVPSVIDSTFLEKIEEFDASIKSIKKQKKEYIAALKF